MNFGALLRSSFPFQSFDVSRIRGDVLPQGKLRSCARGSTSKRERIFTHGCVINFTSKCDRRAKLVDHAPADRQGPRIDGGSERENAPRAAGMGVLVKVDQRGCGHSR
jgi:hypothetical protein